MHARIRRHWSVADNRPRGARLMFGTVEETLNEPETNAKLVVRQGRLERPTLGLEGRCSIQLSYCRIAVEPGFYLIESMQSIIPTPCMQ